MIRRPPRSTRKESSAASDVYKRQVFGFSGEELLKKTEQVARDSLATEDHKSQQKIEFDWDAVLDGVKKDLYFPPSWLFSIKVAKVEGKIVTLEAKTHFQALWVKNHYLQLINDTARSLYGEGGFEVTIDVGEENSWTKETKKNRAPDNHRGIESHLSLIHI